MSIEKSLEKKLVSSKIVAAIEDMVFYDGLSYIEAIVEYCERNGIEIETVSRVIKNNTVLKAKVQEEAEDLNMIEKGGKLPL